MINKISELKNFINKEVTICGWIQNKRLSGKIGFIELRDGTQFVQSVSKSDIIGEDKLKELFSFEQESAIKIIGTVKENPRAIFPYEIVITDFELIASAKNYPISLKEHGIEFLYDNRHLWLRSSRQFAIQKIRSHIIHSMHRFFEENDFTRFDAPIFMSSAAEDSTELFEVKYFDTHAYLSQSGQLYGEAGAYALSKIYTFGPTFRSEKSKTRKHLTEFWMIEPEMAFTNHEDNLKVQEDFVKYVINDVIKNCDEYLKILDRDVNELKHYIDNPFVKITYKEAIKLLNDNGHDITDGDDFGAPHETFIGDHYGVPVFIEKFPKAIKAFYMEEDKEDPNYVLAADLIAPAGYGEIIGGSQRIGDYDKLRQRLADNDLNEEDYSWYLDLRKYGGVTTSGFGLGLERFISFVCKLDHIREAIPFARLLTRLKP